MEPVRRITPAERRRRIAQLEALSDLYEFVRAAWPLVSPTPLIPDPRGEAFDSIVTVCRHLQAAVEGRQPQVILNIPPGHGKSLLTSVFLPAWLWGWRPSAQMLYASHNDGVVLRDADKTRRLIGTDWYQETIVRGRWSLRRDRNTLWHFANDRHGFRQGLTVGGGSTGHRGDILVIDDPLDADHANSEVMRQKVIRWYGNTMSSRFNDMGSAIIILIAQRLHDEDLAGHLILRGGFALLKLQSIMEREVYRTAEEKLAQTKIWKEQRKPGELLSPVKFPMTVLEGAKRDQGTSFSAQHQQDPVDASTAKFPRAAWRFWRYEGDPVVRKRPAGCNTDEAVVIPRQLRKVLVADCGFGKGEKHHDRVGMHGWGGAGPRRFLLDRRTRVMDFVESCAEFERLVEDHPDYELALVEEKASGSAMVSVMRDKVGRLNPSNYRDLVHPQDAKKARATAWSPMLLAGDLFLPDGVVWLDEWVTEFERFPKAAHDDDVDAASLALIGMRETGFSVERWGRLLG